MQFRRKWFKSTLKLMNDYMSDAGQSHTLRSTEKTFGKDYWLLRKNYW